MKVPSFLSLETKASWLLLLASELRHCNWSIRTSESGDSEGKNTGKRRGLGVREEHVTFLS